MSEGRREYVYVIDRVSLRPYCAILQAAYGGDTGVGRFFDPAHWILSPREGSPMRVRGTPEEWRQLADRL